MSVIEGQHSCQRKEEGTELVLINASLPMRDSQLYELHISEGKWKMIRPQGVARQEGAPSCISVEEWSKQRSYEQVVGSRDIRAEKGSETLILDLGGKVILPGMVDIHTHLDKALTIDKVQNQPGTLWAAIQNYKLAVEHFSKEQIKEQMSRTINLALSYGTLAIRSHLNFNQGYSKEVVLRTFQAALEVKESFRGRVDIQLFPMLSPQQMEKGDIQLFEEVMQMGMDGVGGASHLGEHPEANIDEIFRIGMKYNKPIDLHVDENDDPEVKTVDYIAQQTMRHGLEGKVTVGHLCSLAGMPHLEAERIMARMSQAKLRAVTLPAANMYLQGREDRGLIRRGVTRIKELIQADVLVATASDNIQDCFHPFGRADLLQIGLLTAYAAQMASEEELDQLLKMITDIPASIFGIEQYGVEEGNEASFVILDATSKNDLLALLPASRWVFRNGRPLVSSQLSQSFHEAK